MRPLPISDSRFNMMYGSPTYFKSWFWHLGKQHQNTYKFLQQTLFPHELIVYCYHSFQYCQTWSWNLTVAVIELGFGQLLLILPMERANQSFLQSDLQTLKVSDDFFKLKYCGMLAKLAVLDITRPLPNLCALAPIEAFSNKHNLNAWWHGQTG